MVPMGFKHIKRNVALGLCLTTTALVGSLGICTSQSWAATIRAYDKDDHSRIVIDADTIGSYKIEDLGNNTYRIQLDGDSLTNAQTLTSISRAQSVDIDDNGLTLTTAPNGSLRHFKVGQRLIIDVFGDVSKNTSGNVNVSVKTTPAPSPATASNPTSTPAQKTKPAVKTSNTSSETASKVTPKNIEVSTSQASAAKVSVPTVNLRTAAPIKPTTNITQDHLIQMTATETVSVGIFKRLDQLWFVVDKPDFLIPPQIKGPNAQQFGSFKRVSLPQATAFSLSLPNNKQPFTIYAEGGGLIWRVILSTDEDKRPDSQFLEPIGNQLVWKDDDVGRMITFQDPEFNDDIHVITSRDVGTPLTSSVDYIDLYALPSYAGLGFVGKADDIDVAIKESRAVISRPSGLNISDITDMTFLQNMSQNNDESNKELEPYKDMTRIFRFDEWRLGGVSELPENERLLLASASGKDAQDRAGDLMKLAYLELSNGRAAEAIGFLELVADYYPEIQESPQYIATHGAAHAIGGQYDLAFNDFNDPSLTPYDEISLWKAYTLAGLEDWNQAGDNLPPDVGLVSLYPSPLQEKISLRLAEIALRQARVRDADNLLELVRRQSDILSPSDIATLQYLTGELQRQQGEYDEAVATWTSLSETQDDLYRAKAGLALTRLMYDNNELDAADAIDNLERLRYAWRGDDLETQINYRLGLAYIENKDYIQGLNIMRKAVSRSPDPELAKDIAAKMTEIFNDVFTTDEINNLDPIETITLFEEFSELAPSGQDGNALINNLTERLIDIDLLGRASSLLTNQVDNKLSGAEGARGAIRLASIQLEDNKDDLALQSLDKAANFLIETPDIAPRTKAALTQDIGLLRAHAFAEKGLTDQALVTLSRLTQNKTTLKMRADVAWRAGRWQSASEALEEMINSETINLNAPLSDEHATMILNWGVTLNLSDNRYILNSLRDRFGDAMAQTDKGDEFDVITRPEKNVFLADRKTIENIVSEVDIFKDFLDSYQGG